MNATKSKRAPFADKAQRERYGRWLDRKTPSIDEWGDIHMWVDGEPVEPDDEIQLRNQELDMWRVVADDYEESLYSYDIDYDDYWFGWDRQSLTSVINKPHEENQCWEDRTVYTDAWSRRDDVEWCWCVHEEQTEREISDYYERESQMNEDEEIEFDYRSVEAWNPNHYLFGMHPPKR